MAPTGTLRLHSDHAAHQRDRVETVDALAAVLAGETDRARRAELARALGVSVEEVEEARGVSAGYHAVSLDAPTSADTNLADQLLVTSSHSGTIERLRCELADDGPQTHDAVA